MIEFFLVCLLDVLLRSSDWPRTGHELPADGVDVLSSLVSELGDDNGGAWPWKATVTPPESEFFVCSVHIANFASQTFVATHE